MEPLPVSPLLLASSPTQIILVSWHALLANSPQGALQLALYVTVKASIATRRELLLVRQLQLVRSQGLAVKALNPALQEGSRQVELMIAQCAVTKRLAPKEQQGAPPALPVLLGGT